MKNSGKSLGIDHQQHPEAHFNMNRYPNGAFEVDEDICPEVDEDVCPEVDEDVCPEVDEDICPEIDEDICPEVDEELYYS